MASLGIRGSRLIHFVICLCSVSSGFAFSSGGGDDYLAQNRRPSPPAELPLRPRQNAAPALASSSAAEDGPGGVGGPGSLGGIGPPGGGRLREGFLDQQQQPPPLHRDGWKWWRYHELSEKEILDHLVHRQRYDRRELPPTSGPLRINVSATLLSVDFPSRLESAKPNVLDLYLQQMWFDPRLIHNDKQYTTLNGAHHHRDLWLPNPYFNARRVDFAEHQASASNIALNIHGNGSVQYVVRSQIEMDCQSDEPGLFPFDKPSCSFTIESVSHSVNEVAWKWLEPQGVFLASKLLSNSMSLGNIFTLDCSTNYPWKGNHSCLHLELVFSRDIEFYLLNNFFPDIVLVFCSFLTFWIDHQSSMIARILLATLTLLNFSTTVQFSKLSSSNALQVWHLISLLFIFGSCVQFVAVKFLTKRYGKVKGCRHRGDNIGYQTDFRRPNPHPDYTATLRPHHHHHLHAHQIQQNLGQLHSTSMLAVEGCAKCVPGGSPFRATADFGMNETLEDSRSISSGLFDRKILRDESSMYSQDRKSSRVAKKLDNISRLVFPVLYIIFVLAYFCKYVRCGKKKKINAARIQEIHNPTPRGVLEPKAALAQPDNNVKPSSPLEGGSPNQVGLGGQEQAEGPRGTCPAFQTVVGPLPLSSSRPMQPMQANIMPPNPADDGSCLTLFTEALGTHRRAKRQTVESTVTGTTGGWFTYIPGFGSDSSSSYSSYSTISCPNSR